MPPSRLQRTLGDDRVILGAVVFCVAAFVGTTYNTLAVCLSWVAVAVVGAIVTRILRRRFLSKSDFQPTASESNWVQTFVKTGLLIAFIAIGVWVIFQWRFVLKLNERSNLLILTVDAIGHSSLITLCVLWMVRSARGHLLMLVLGMIAVLMAVAGGGVSSTLTAQTAMGLASSIGFVIAAQVILSRHFANTAANSNRPAQSNRISTRSRSDRHVDVSLTSTVADLESRFSFTSQSWWYSLLTVSIVLIVGSAAARGHRGRVAFGSNASIRKTQRPLRRPHLFRFDCQWTLCHGRSHR